MRNTLRHPDQAPLILAAVAALGLVLCFAGWRGAYDGSHIDDIGNRANSRALVEIGEIPVTNGLSGLGGYNAAGSSWYYVPSVFFADIRIGERFTAFLLYLLTVIPLYLLGVLVTDRPTALIIALLYTISAMGIFFEHSLWYRARPFAYAWLTYFAIRWLQSGEGKFLFATIVALGLGLLINLEMAPIVIGLGFAWRKYGRPVSVIPAVAGVAVVLVAWAPYLNFEVDRGFVDLRSSLTLTQIGPDRLGTEESYGDEIRTWSYDEARLGPFTPTSTQARKERSLLKRALIRAYLAGRMSLSNFRHGHPLGIVPFVLVALFGLTVWIHLGGWWEGPWARNLTTLLGLGLIALAVGFNQLTIPAIIGRDLGPQELSGLQWLQSGLVLAGLAIALRKWVRAILARTAARLRLGGVRHPLPGALRMLSTIVLPTWLLFVILAHFERFLFGFWVLQLLLVGAFLIYLPRYLELNGRARVVSLVLAVVLVVPNDEVVGIVGSTLKGAYAGTQSDLMQAVDAVAERATLREWTRPRVGYLVYFGNGYELVWGLQDSRYGGLGSALHQYLRLQHGLDPPQPPPEGFSGADDYRIVQTRPDNPDLPHRFAMEDIEAFRSIGQYGHFEVLERVALHEI